MPFIDEDLTGFAAEFGFGSALTGNAGFDCTGGWAFVIAVLEGLAALTPGFEGSS